MAADRDIQELRESITDLTAALAVTQSELSSLRTAITTWQELRCSEHHETLLSHARAIRTLQAGASTFGGKMQGFVIAALLVFNLAILGTAIWQGMSAQRAIERHTDAVEVLNGH